LTFQGDFYDTFSKTKPKNRKITTSGGLSYLIFRKISKTWFSMTKLGDLTVGTGTGNKKRLM